MRSVWEVPKKNIATALVLFFVLVMLLAWRLRMPEAGLDAHGIHTWIRIFFLLILYLYISLIAFGLGQLLLEWFNLSLLTKAESTILAYLLGLGGLSAGVMFLGLVGWLNAGAIFFGLALLGVVSLGKWTGIRQLAAAARPVGAKFSYLTFLQVILSVSIPLLLLECLLPVWDYDALLYHLEVPRQFLAHGGFYFNPEVLRSAYPYLGEMPFLIGMVFNLDSLAHLVNFTYAILFVLSSYVLSRRSFGPESAYTTVGILIGAPAFWIWATWAGIDFAWAAYEFWSVYAVLLWLADDKKNSRKWMMVAGIMSGLAAGTKYLSLSSLLIVAAIIMWKSGQTSERRTKEIFSNLLIFGLASGLTAGAWYIKNWIETGNPVYPLLIGGPGWEPLENRVLNDYVYSFGVGKSWLDYLLLPYNVYAFHNRFSTLGLEIIHPALWLAFLFPFVWKASKNYDVIIVYTVLVFVAWAINSQVIRFLVPWMAFGAILAGAAIETFPFILKSLLRIGLIGGFILFNLTFQVQWMQRIDVWGYLDGQKSPGEFLDGMNYDFRAVRYTQETLRAGEKALLLWDGRGYYCDSHCIPDDEQSTAVRLAFESPSPQKLAGELQQAGITHLLLSRPDANWFIAYHDPHGLHRAALDYFTNIFLPACGKPVFKDGGMTLFEVTCH